MVILCERNFPTGNCVETEDVASTLQTNHKSIFSIKPVYFFGCKSFSERYPLSRGQNKQDNSEWKQFNRENVW